MSTVADDVCTMKIKQHDGHLPIASRTNWNMLKILLVYIVCVLLSSGRLHARNVSVFRTTLYHCQKKGVTLSLFLKGIKLVITRENL